MREDEELIDTATLAKWIGVCPNTIDKWAITGRGPVPLKLGLRIRRYRLKDVRVWLAEQEARATR